MANRSNEDHLSTIPSFLFACSNQAHCAHLKRKTLNQLPRASSASRRSHHAVQPPRPHPSPFLPSTRHKTHTTSFPEDPASELMLIQGESSRISMPCTEWGLWPCGPVLVAIAQQFGRRLAALVIQRSPNDSLDSNRGLELFFGWEAYIGFHMPFCYCFRDSLAVLMKLTY
jgi:hypothetical protein